MEQLGPGDPRGIGAYRLLARLGAGGMGYVYLARSDRGRTVAVKLVRAELARREEFRARFRQEVRAARQVGGFWTAPVLDADTEAEIPWVATGYVAGPSLERIVGRDHGALPERSVRILAAGLAHALKDIHAAGIVHRDLKPSNVLVTIDGPRVIDFGIARALETVTDAGQTRTGVVVGSPGFMAPEQVRGERLTPACDVFCLGSVLAYAATGRLPFGSAHSGAHALMFRIAEEEPDLTGVPEGIADLVRDCLAKDPSARPAPDRILERTGAEDTVTDGRSRDPWLPASLVAQLGRHAVSLLDAEDPTRVTPAGPSPVVPSPEEPPPAVATPVRATPVGPAPVSGGWSVPDVPGAGGPVPRPGAGEGPVPGRVPGPAASGPGPRSGPGSRSGPGPVPVQGLGPLPGPGVSGGLLPAVPGAPVPVAPVGPSEGPAGRQGGAAAGLSPEKPGGPDGAGGGARSGGGEAGARETPGACSGGVPGGAAEPGAADPAGAGRVPAPPFAPAIPGSQGTAGARGTLGAQGFVGAQSPAPAWPGAHGGPAAPHPPAAHHAPGDGPAPAPPPYGVPAAPGGTPPHGPSDPHLARQPDHLRPRPTQQGGGTARSPLLLVVIAFVVALAAGGSVYAWMNKGNADRSDGGPRPSPSVTAGRGQTGTGASEPDPDPSADDSASPAADGAVPEEYLGTWTTTIDNASGRHTRRLTLRQGEAGDAVMSLDAEGPVEGGDEYRCEFVAELSEEPDADGPLSLGPSTVRSGPTTACSPGAGTELTLLPDGTLERVNPSTGERLVYEKE